MNQVSWRCRIHREDTATEKIRTQANLIYYILVHEQLASSEFECVVQLVQRISWNIFTMHQNLRIIVSMMIFFFSIIIFDNQLIILLVSTTKQSFHHSIVSSLQAKLICGHLQYFVIPVTVDLGEPIFCIVGLRKTSSEPGVIINLFRG